MSKIDLVYASDAEEKYVLKDGSNVHFDAHEITCLFVLRRLNIDEVLYILGFPIEHLCVTATMRKRELCKKLLNIFDKNMIEWAEEGDKILVDDFFFKDCVKINLGVRKVLSSLRTGTISDKILFKIERYLFYSGEIIIRDNIDTLSIPPSSIKDASQSNLTV